MISGYPKNREQYNLLLEFLNTNPISINSIWYLKHEDLDFVAKNQYDINKKFNDKYENSIDSIKEKIIENTIYT